MPLLTDVGLRIVDEPEPDLITRVIRIWRSGEWIVIDDEGGELGEDARDSGRWRTCALAIQVLHSDVAVIERYDHGGRLGAVSIRPSGGAPSKKLASVFSGLMPAESSAAVSAAFAQDAAAVESKLERVFEVLGLPSPIHVPDSTDVLVLTDGRTRPINQPASPPNLWTLGLFPDVTLNGIEGQRFSTAARYLTIDNFGGYASVLAVDFSGSALELDILRIERVLLTSQPGRGWVGAEAQSTVVAAWDGGPARFAVGNASGGPTPQRLDNELPAFTLRERWCVAIEGTRSTPGVGELTITVTADDATAAVARVEVAVLGEEQVPRRGSIDHATGTADSKWSGLKALTGDRCLAAMIVLAPEAVLGDIRSIVLRSWAEAALRSKTIARLPIVGDITGVRNLKLEDLDRASRWSKLESQLESARTCLVGPDLVGKPIRTLYKFDVYDPDVIHATLDLDTIDEAEAWDTLRSLVDRLASTGVVDQATITPCDHWLATRSRYELAVGADRHASDREYLFEPGRTMYLSPSLIGLLDRSDLSHTFELTHLRDRVRLVARSSASPLDIEQVVTPILRPLLSSDEG